MWAGEQDSYMPDRYSKAKSLQAEVLEMYKHLGIYSKIVLFKGLLVMRGFFHWFIQE